ncbi:MAG: hypothetical protein JWP01_538 [Myxococcales bacterium]|nr:hypothetical protein [Myxococcales bacterium]
MVGAMRWVLALLTVMSACKQSEAPPPPPITREQTLPEPVTPPPPRCQPGERTCVQHELVQCKADGSLGATIESCKGACREGACVDTCALQDVELIYVIDDDANLFSFDPKKLPADPFHKIAQLSCDPSSTVNSMAIDRFGIAWLGYHNGNVHRASIIDGRCAASVGAPSGAPTTFGMGFVTDGPKATTEKLFVAGGSVDGKVDKLGTVDTSGSRAAWIPVASLDRNAQHPELTGTGEGRLFAYFPSPGRGFVQELDRTTAKPIGTKWVVRGLARHVSAYAFAHWGGVFYVFTTADGDSSVHAIHMKDGKQELVRDKLPNVIVGAGVSTCAPLLERAP